MGNKTLQEIKDGFAATVPIKGTTWHYRSWKDLADDTDPKHLLYYLEQAIEPYLSQPATPVQSEQVSSAGQWVNGADRLPDDTEGIAFRDVVNKKSLDVYSYFTSTEVELNDADELQQSVGTLVKRELIEWYDQSLSPTTQEGQRAAIIDFLNWATKQENTDLTMGADTPEQIFDLYISNNK